MKNYGDGPTLTDLNSLVDKIMTEAEKLGLKAKHSGLASCAYCLRNNLGTHETCEVDAWGKREIICVQCLDLLENPGGYDLPHKFNQPKFRGIK